MDRVLGIDIGSYSIKLTLLRVEEQATAIEGMFEQKIDYDTEKSDQACQSLALEQLLKQSGIQFNSTYAALSSDQTIAKRFEFYKLKRRDRQMVLENEFDSLGLFPMEEYGLEYHTIDYKAEKTPLLGILFQKQALSNLIDVLSRSQLQPRVIDIDSMAYLNLASFFPKESVPEKEAAEEVPENEDNVATVKQKPVLIVNIGHQKTAMTLIMGNKVQMSRTTQTAGKYFTRCLQKEQNLDFEQAEKLKHDLSAQGISSQAAGAKSLNDCYQDLALEIKQTLQSLAANGFFQVPQIFLTGSASLYSGIEQIFEKATGCVVKKLGSVGNDFLDSKALKQNVSFETFSQSIAIGLRGTFAQDNSSLNLRHGEFSMTTNYEQIVGQILSFSKIVAVIFICLMGTYLFRYFSYSGKIHAMQSNYKKEINAVLGGEPQELKVLSKQKNLDFHEYSEHAAKLMQDSIENKRDLLADFNNGSNPLGLRVLNDISVAIPKDVYFEVSEFKLTEQNLYIEADTDSQKALDSILSYLKGIKSLSHLEKKSQENKAGTAGQIIHFALTAVVDK